MRSDFGRTSAANRAAGRRFSARAVLYNLYYLFNISKSSILLFDFSTITSSVLPSGADLVAPGPGAAAHNGGAVGGDLFHAVIQFIIAEQLCHKAGGQI